jgi:hypothetical protein
VRLARLWARQGHRGRRHGQGHDGTRSGDGPYGMRSGDGPYGTRSGDGPYGTRRPSLTPCPVMGDTARDDHPRRRVRRPAIPHATHLVSDDARICPDMPGMCSEYTRLCLMMPDDVLLPGLSGDRIMGCERPNAGRQVCRWRRS